MCVDVHVCPLYHFSTSIPFHIPLLAFLVPTMQHARGGGLHIGRSVGVSVYLPCTKNPINNMVPFFCVRLIIFFGSGDGPC